MSNDRTGHTPIPIEAPGLASADVERLVHVASLDARVGEIQRFSPTVGLGKIPRPSG